jgi:hypothetical protein
LTTGLGDNNSVGRLLGGLLLVSLTQSDTNTTSGREDGDSLFYMKIYICGEYSRYSQKKNFFLVKKYLVVGKTRVLERVDVLQVSGFRRELNIVTLNKERVVVLDNSPDQIGTHVLKCDVKYKKKYI